MNIMEYRKKFILSVLVLTSLVSYSQMEYEPTKKSLSQYEVPEW